MQNLWWTGLFKDKLSGILTNDTQKLVCVHNLDEQKSEKLLYNNRLMKEKATVSFRGIQCW